MGRIENLYGKKITASELLEKWDNDEIVPTIEMGGLGPGYEQCIHILVFEIIRDYKDIPFEEVYKLKPGEFGEGTVNRTNPKMGYSGGQVRVAKWLAFQILEDTDILSDSKFEDRFIMVSKKFPQL